MRNFVRETLFAALLYPVTLHSLEILTSCCFMSEVFSNYSSYVQKLSYLVWTLNKKTGFVFKWSINVKQNEEEVYIHTIAIFFSIYTNICWTLLTWHRSPRYVSRWLLRVWLCMKKRHSSTTTHDTLLYFLHLALLRISTKYWNLSLTFFSCSHCKLSTMETILYSELLWAE